MYLGSLSIYILSSNVVSLSRPLLKLVDMTLLDIARCRPMSKWTLFASVAWCRMWQRVDWPKSCRTTKLSLGRLVVTFDKIVAILSNVTMCRPTKMLSHDKIVAQSTHCHIWHRATKTKSVHFDIGRQRAMSSNVMSTSFKSGFVSDTTLND